LNRAGPAAGAQAGHRRFLALFALLSLTMGMSVGVSKIVTTLYAMHLQAGPAQLGLINGGGMVGILVMSLPIGFLVDHWGPRRLFLIGSALGGLTYALFPWAASPWLLLLGSTVVGFIMPLRFVALNTVFFAQIRSMGEGKAGWSRATHMSGMFLIGPALGALLAASLGYSTSWWLIAGSFALTAAISPLVMQHAAEATASVQAPPAAGGWRGLAGALRTLATDPELREVNLIDFVGQGATVYTTTFIVVLALRQFGLDPGQASALVTAWGGAFIAALFFGGRLGQRLGARRSVLLGSAGIALGLLLLGLATGAAWLWPGVLLQGLGSGLVQVVNLGRIARIGARLGRGRVSGMNLLIGPLGGLLGSTLGGLLGQRLGLQPVFFCFVPGLALLAAWQLRRETQAALETAA
jgi:MFS family permease